VDGTVFRLVYFKGNSKRWDRNRRRGEGHTTVALGGENNAGNA
jgi:hypothetical protein